MKIFDESFEEAYKQGFLAGRRLALQESYYLNEAFFDKDKFLKIFAEKLKDAILSHKEAKEKHLKPSDVDKAVDICVKKLKTNSKFTGVLQKKISTVNESYFLTEDISIIQPIVNTLSPIVTPILQSAFEYLKMELSYATVVFAVGMALQLAIIAFFKTLDIYKNIKNKASNFASNVKDKIDRAKFKLGMKATDTVTQLAGAETVKRKISVNDLPPDVAAELGIK